MLRDQKLKAFIPTIDPDRARRFYVNLLGFNLLTEDYYGMELETNGSLLRISTVQQFIPHPFTVLGWDVDDLPSIMTSLIRRGVVFERYNIIDQDSRGIWTAPNGTKVAWFKDPDGNLLSLTEFDSSNQPIEEDSIIY
jgi:catechol 2,3-dioxygenase-like lactoylglutathione lyase family enzyme